MFGRLFGARNVQIQSDEVEIIGDTNFLPGTGSVKINGVPISTQVLTLCPVGSSPNVNGASISAGVLTLQPASSTNGGLMTPLTQTFGGNKAFNGDVVLNGAVNLTNVVADSDAIFETVTRNVANGLLSTASIINETFYTSNPAQAITLNPTTPTLLTFNTLGTPSDVSGVEEFAPGQYVLRRVGNYKFRIQFTGPTNARYYVQMRNNNVPYDGESRETTAPVFDGFENSVSWTFFSSRSVTAGPDLISFYALGEIMGDTPSNVTVNHELIFSLDGRHV